MFASRFTYRPSAVAVTLSKCTSAKDQRSCCWLLVCVHVMRNRDFPAPAAPSGETMTIQRFLISEFFLKNSMKGESAGWHWGRLRCHEVLHLWRHTAPGSPDAARHPPVPGHAVIPLWTSTRTPAKFLMCLAVGLDPVLPWRCASFGQPVPSGPIHTPMTCD